MTVSFETVTLDAGEDEEGMMLLRDGRLLAILCRLGPSHDELQGRWFVEAAFGDHGLRTGITFGDLAEAEAWAMADASPGAQAKPSSLSH